MSSERLATESSLRLHPPALLHLSGLSWLYPDQARSRTRTWKAGDPQPTSATYVPSISATWRTTAPKSPRPNQSCSSSSESRRAHSDRTQRRTTSPSLPSKRSFTQQRLSPHLGETPIRGQNPRSRAYGLNFAVALISHPPSRSMIAPVSFQRRRPQPGAPDFRKAVGATAVTSTVYISSNESMNLVRRRK